MSIEELTKKIQQEEMESRLSEQKQIADVIRGLTESLGGIILACLKKGLITEKEIAEAQSQVVTNLDQQISKQQEVAREEWAKIEGGAEIFDRVFGK